MMTIAGSETKDRFEIRIGGDRYDFENHAGARMRLLDDDEFLNLLRDRLGKSESEINQLLESYKQSVGKI